MATITTERPSSDSPVLPKCPMFTLHAMERWNDRFPGKSPATAFRSSFYAGRAKRKAHYFISRTVPAAAFVVDKNVVITVILSDWAFQKLKQRGITTYIDRVDVIGGLNPKRIFRALVAGLRRFTSFVQR